MEEAVPADGRPRMVARWDICIGEALKSAVRLTFPRARC
jgi:hypothetical protein